MNTPIKGIIIVCSIMLALCLIGAGVLEVRKHKAQTIAREKLEREEAYFLPGKNPAHQPAAARELARLASDLKNITVIQTVRARQIELEQWSEANVGHPLYRDGAGLAFECAQAIRNAASPIESIAQGSLESLNQSAADVFQMAVNFKP